MVQYSFFTGKSTTETNQESSRLDDVKIQYNLLRDLPLWATRRPAVILYLVYSCYVGSIANGKVNLKDIPW